LESLVKRFLNNNTNLKRSIPKLLEKLSLPDQWGKILFNFCDYSHEFSSQHRRKEGVKPANINPEIIESYIYFRGLVIRLLILSQRNNFR